MYVLCLLFLSALTVFGADAKEAKATAERLDSAANVMKEIMATPDKGIPEDLLAKANCVVVVPSLKKGAFIVNVSTDVSVHVIRSPTI